MSDKYDFLFYQPAFALKILSILKMPSPRECEDRGVIGMRWCPGYPRPIGFEGPADDWCAVWGNFIGYESDVNRMACLCDLREIEVGLIGGVLKGGVLETKRYQYKAQHQTRMEAANKVALLTTAPKQTSEEWAKAADAAALDYLLMVASLCGAVAPENMSMERLTNCLRFAIMKGIVGEDDGEKWQLARCGPEPIREPGELQKQMKLITFENVAKDAFWEKHLLTGFCALPCRKITVDAPEKQTA